MTRALVALVALALVFPAASLAKATQTNAPPGNSAIDQYLETAPGASGNVRPHPPGAGGGGGLPPAQRARLNKLGPDGRALAAAVDATSSAKQTSKKKDVTLPNGDGRSPLREVFGAVAGHDDGSGMGLLLPAVLIAALLAVLMAVLLRRRAAS